MPKSQADIVARLTWRKELVAKKEILIQEVKSRQPLWDKTSGRRKRDVVCRLWKEVASALGISVTEAKFMWRNLSDRFRQVHCDATRGKKVKWVHYSSLMFLQDQICRNHSVTEAITEPRETGDVEDMSSSHPVPTETEQHILVFASETPSLATKRTQQPPWLNIKRAAEVTDHEDVEKQLSSLKQSVDHILREHSNDKYTALGNYISATLKNDVPEELKKKCEWDILKVVQSYSLGKVPIVQSAIDDCEMRVVELI